MTGREEMKGEREKLRDAARRVVREYVHGPTEDRRRRARGRSVSGNAARPPELAYSWPGVIFALTFVFIALMIAGLGWARIGAWVCLVGAFACCPIRDAILDRYWPEQP